jgi:hypothetical protein
MLVIPVEKMIFRLVCQRFCVRRQFPWPRLRYKIGGDIAQDIESGKVTFRLFNAFGI